MAKPNFIELDDGRELTRIPILFEDRSIIAIDKPVWWMLVPFDWQRTNRNLQAALVSSIAAGDFWARSRNLKFLRHVHRLDAETTGILLFAKSPGAVEAYSRMFMEHRVEKKYLVVVEGIPKQTEWICRLKLAQDPGEIGRVVVDEREGKEAETHFRVCETVGGRTLLEARPYSGRTHQIRVHAFESGHPVVGDSLYGVGAGRQTFSGRGMEFPMGLRAVEVRYVDPFTRRAIRILAPGEGFRNSFGFSAAVHS